MELHKENNSKKKIKMACFINKIILTLMFYIDGIVN